MVAVAAEKFRQRPSGERSTLTAVVSAVVDAVVDAVIGAIVAVTFY